MRLLNLISDNLTSFEKKALTFLLVSFLVGSIIELSGTRHHGEQRRVDLNSASLEELSAVPGVGEKTAQKILRFREKQGRISNLDEIEDVVGKKKFKKIRRYLTVEGQN